MPIANDEFLQGPVTFFRGEDLEIVNFMERQVLPLRER